MVTNKLTEILLLDKQDKPIRLESKILQLLSFPYAFMMHLEFPPFHVNMPKLNDGWKGSLFSPK